MARSVTGELQLFDDTFAAPVLDPTGSAGTASPGPAVGVEPGAPSPGDAPVEADIPFTVVVVRSPKRKRSVGARLVSGVLTVTVPTWMSRAEEAHWVATMSGRFRRKMSTERIDLADRCSTLARRHDLPRPREVRWSDDMLTQWGSCTPATGIIRISTRIARFPDWVIDYVLVHELAHLEEANHSAAFWRLVHRFPKAERAIGYLIAKSGDDVDEL